MSTVPQVIFEHIPESSIQPPRRQFLKQLLGGVAATGTLLNLGFSGIGDLYQRLKEAAATLNQDQTGDEHFWGLVMDQFALRDDLIVMNAANLCPSPYTVMETVFGLTRDIDSDPSHQNRSKFSDLRAHARIALAGYLNADPDEIVITRNTSEGNNVVISGLTLGPGDEVVIWDQNHPTNNLAWDVGSERHGYTVKRVATPVNPREMEDLIRPFRLAFDRNTKVLAFSHVSNISGVALPAKILCRNARERGITTLVDGAQTFGAEVLNLHDMGCDFFTGSTHKWPMGPKEAGVLYARKECIGDVWPLIVGIGWDGDTGSAAPKYEALGQRDDARIAAVGKTIEFHNTIGKQRIEARIRALAAELKNQIEKRIPGTRFHTPLPPEFSSGVLVFTPPGVDLNRAFTTLYEEYRIGCAVMRGDFAGIRLSPHIYNSMEQIEKAVAAVSSLAQ